jgi:hypothetical protein
VNGSYFFGWLVVAVVVIGCGAVASGWARTAPKRTLVFIAVTAGLALWTVVAVVAFVGADFASADTRCGSAVAHPKVQEPGGIQAVATVVVWAIPFLVVFGLRRTPASVVLGILVLATIAFAIWPIFAHPSSFCF